MSTRSQALRTVVQWMRDVKGLNAIQLLGAENNLYYCNDVATQAAIDDLPLRWHRPHVESVRVKRARSNVDGSYLLVFYRQQPDVHLDLRCLRVRDGMNRVPLRERAHSWRIGAREIERVVSPEAALGAQRSREPPGQRWSFLDDDEATTSPSRTK
jgi:hypothetical protein